ncbi:MAG: hypothetical protein JXB00_14630 [Bacteroidales bacterium]|nr:hypothetical protein [Bacteroidales bacterium]
MLPKKQLHPCLIINIIFIILIIAFFLYFIIYTPDSGYPVKSGYTSVTGKKSISTGLSRSLSSVARLELNEAKKYNPYGLQVFSFFFIQLILRIVAVIFILKPVSKPVLLTVFDAAITLVLFIICFSPFIIEAFGYIYPDFSFF